VTWEHIRAVRDNPPADLKPAATAVLLALAAYANTAGEAYPSISRLSKLTGAHPSSVRRCLERLTELELITITINAGRPSLIRLIYPAPIARTTPRIGARIPAGNRAPAEHEEVKSEVKSEDAPARDEPYRDAEPPGMPLDERLTARLARRPNGIQLTMEVDAWPSNGTPATDA
jgi:hypothetical protein